MDTGILGVPPLADNVLGEGPQPADSKQAGFVVYCA